MRRTLEDLLREFSGNSPASSQEITSVEAVFGKPLPDAFRSFLKIANGGDGFHGTHYAMLWNAREIVELNESYQARAYSPGLMLIGSNGGGEAYALDSRILSSPVVRVPFVGMDLTLAQPFEPTIASFLEMLERKKAANPGIEVFEIKPIIVGGHPTDPANKTMLTRQKHIELVRWWNKVISDARKQRGQ
jgi:SMI1 / KNR4 family (SUKH-1)